MQTIAVNLKGVRCSNEGMLGVSNGCAGLQEEVSALRKQLGEARSAAAMAQAKGLASQAQTVKDGCKMLVARLDGVDPKAMQVRPDFLLPQSCASEGSFVAVESNLVLVKLTN